MGVWEHVPEFLDLKFDFDVLRESGISQFKKIDLIENFDFDVFFTFTWKRSKVKKIAELDDTGQMPSNCPEPTTVAGQPAQLMYK